MMSPVDAVRIEIPAKFHYLATLSNAIESLLHDAWKVPCSQETLYEVQLAVHEICNNIIQHAYGHEEGTIWVEIEFTGRGQRLHVILRDRGQPFDISSVEEPDLDIAQEHGYGLFLVRRLMDEVHYEVKNDTNVWHLTKTVR